MNFRLLFIQAGISKNDFNNSSDKIKIKLVPFFKNLLQNCPIAAPVDSCGVGVHQPKSLPALEYDSHPLMLRRTIPALRLHTLLLLAALFNALAGVPLHEARHIREAVRSVQEATVDASGVEVYAADEARIDAATSEQDTEEPHATCAWCLTHALDAGLAHTAASPQLPPTELRMAPPQGVVSLMAQQVRWPFAARAPPPAQRA